MRQALYILLLSIFLFIYSCEKDNESDKSGIHPVFKETLSGFAQKGPFIVGSSIAIAELDAGLNQTGRTFNAQISATSIESGKNCDLLIYFAPPQGSQTEVSDTTDTSGSIITVDFYENFSEEPTRTKMLYIDGTPPEENP
jgi:hypothetical protein